MPAFIDARCPKCDKRIGWFGEMKDNPGCSRCGWFPGTKEEQEAAQKDQEEINRFRQFLRDRKRAKEEKIKGDPLTVACPVFHCRAPKGQSCKNADKTLRTEVHSPRQDRADYEARKNKPQKGEGHGD